MGTSTRADVLKLLGPPTRVVELLDSDAYVYQHAIEKGTGLFLIVFNTVRSDRQLDGVTVIVDRDAPFQVVIRNIERGGPPPRTA